MIANARQGTFKEIELSSYLPSERELVAMMFADMLEQNEKLSVWRNLYQSLPMHELLRYRYEVANIAPLERDPPAQADPHWAPNQVQVFLLFGATRSGKTNSAVAFSMEYMCGVPGLSVLAVRHTYDEIHDTIFGDVQRFCTRYGIEVSAHIDPPELALPNGSKLLFRSAKRDEKPGQDKASSLQGMEFGACILEEADRIPEHYFETVISRLSQSGLSNPWVLILCNPPSKNHWIYKRFFKPDATLRKIPDNYHPLHYPLEHNRHNLRPGYIEDLERELAASPSRYDRFFQGLFTAPVIGKALFKKYFSQSSHVLPYFDPRESRIDILTGGEIVLLDGVDLWVGFDFGFVHPAVVVAQEDPETGQVRVLWEYMGNEVMVQPFVEDVKRRIGRRFPGLQTRWFVDPHGRARNSQTGRSDLQVLMDCGVTPTYKDVSVSAGLSIMANLLYTYLHELTPPRPMLVVAENCSDLIDGFTFGYTQDPRKHVDGADDELTPHKDGYFEHLFDALRYIIVCTRHTGRSRKPKGGRRGPAGTWYGGTKATMDEDKFDGWGREKFFGMEQFEEQAPSAQKAPYYGFGEATQD